MPSSDCELVPIHVIPEPRRRNAVEYCCLLLNREWPCAGYNSREKWLEQSNSGFPISLVMISPETKDNNATNSGDHPRKRQQVMMGHSRICRVQGEDDDCFIGSIIIDPEWRRKGYGSLLVQLTEKFAVLECGFKRAHLDIERPELISFYRGLGYKRNVTSHLDPIVPIDTQDPSIVDKFGEFLYEYSPVTITRYVCEWFGTIFGDTSGSSQLSQGNSDSTWNALRNALRRFINANKLTYWSKDLDWDDSEAREEHEGSHNAGDHED
ncbi:unnamed protein product [Notodromas monacha]|uniref:N-acetyltransferase domain-containing protein n=1 Tax=Notodromas monacha TaxID=399045 RepID=A0A7R9BLT6_9CRUS|nr:unnamed protein product [Notodromas monacha]CAG0917862.1 unnamed protein product [Notodromas monacha]